MLVDKMPNHYENHKQLKLYKTMATALSHVTRLCCRWMRTIRIVVNENIKATMEHTIENEKLIM